MYGIVYLRQNFFHVENALIISRFIMLTLCETSVSYGKQGILRETSFSNLYREGKKYYQFVSFCLLRERKCLMTFRISFETPGLPAQLNFSMLVTHQSFCCSFLPCLLNLFPASGSFQEPALCTRGQPSHWSFSFKTNFLKMDSLQDLGVSTAWF